VGVVVAPDGRRWKVKRRWLRWRFATDPGPYLGGFEDLLFALALPAVGLVLQALFLPLVALWRVGARRPWLVTARTEGPPIDAYAWDVVGFGASAKARDDVTVALERGEEPRPRGARIVPYGLRL
jgi:hypothetical protein